MLALSFERIHRSTLIGMGVLPLRLPAEFGPERLNLEPGDIVTISASPEEIFPRCPVPVTIRRKDGSSFSFDASAAIETYVEIRTLKAGGILPFILNEVLNSTGKVKRADGDRQ